MKSVLVSSLMALLLCTVSCGGGGGSNDTEGKTFDFNGTWSVRYNALEAITQMTCGNLFGEDSFAFIDNHIVSQSGMDISLRAESSVIIGIGSVDENNKLTATEVLSGNLFGDDRMCTLTLVVTYENVTNDSADTLFLQSLSCNDGLVCEDQAFGSATRAS